MIKKAPINARLDATAIAALKQEAKNTGQTITDILEKIVDDHQRGGGPEGERKIAALEARIQEQERILRKHTGRSTTSKRRITLTISHEAAQRLDKEAAAGGMTRSELIDHAVMSKAKRLTIQRPNMPALK